ncbi:MAG: RNA polymerase sigma factor [Acidobacteriota bacterium]
MHPEDAQLVDDYLSGQPAAMSAVEGWIHHAAQPYRRRLMAQWDDVLQDVRLEITRLLQLGTFRGESALKTYLWRVVCHTCLDRIRSQSRWNWSDLDAMPDYEAETILTDSDPKLRQESKDLLERVLGEISDECRKLWTLVLRGLSYREMSQQMEVAEGTLRVRVLRCRKRAIELRQKLLGSETA